MSRSTSFHNSTIDVMLIHSVFFWLRKDLTADERALFESEVRRLAEISYLERAYVGIPAPTDDRPVTDHSFDYAAALHFKSLEDHDFYQAKCEEHTRFVTTCKPLWERVVIYDTLPL
jgi:stress responsive alpha/beta barrel protein